MTEAWNIFFSIWPVWVRSHLVWLLLGVAFLVTVLVMVRLIRFLVFRTRLPHEAARSEWTTFHRYHTPRMVRSSHDLKSRHISGQLALFRHHLDQDLGHYLVFLVPMGGGKTWGLYEVMKWLHKRYRRTFMVSMNQENPLKSIADIRRKEQTWLILDDLDAYFPELQARERINMLLEATSGFKAVILAVQPERWPSVWSRPDQLGRIKLVGEDYFEWGMSAYFVEWDADESVFWLRRFAKGTNMKGIRRVIDGVDWRHGIWHRPVVLNMLILSAGMGGPTLFLSEVIDRVLKRAIGSNDEWWNRLEEMVTQQVVVDLSTCPRGCRSILKTNPDGHTRFRYRFLEGFFLARHAVNRQDQSVFRELVSHPEARYLYLEKVWSRFLDHAGPDPGHVLLPESMKPLPLRSLPFDQVTEVEYLELDSAALPHLQFLRLMRHLRRIWVRIGSESDLANITPHWKAQNGARIWMNTGSGQRIGWERINRFGEQKRWEPIPDVTSLHPAFVSDTVIERGPTHPFRQIFRLDPDKLPNPICQPMDIPLDDQDGLEAVYEMNLGAGEFDLFDKVYVFEFESGDIHLQYLHTRSSNNLVSILSDIIDRWVTFIGPDDHGRRELLPEEIVDIRQGAWPGRTWLNLHPAEFDRQALLQMTQPGFVEIWIRNGKPQPAPIS